MVAPGAWRATTSLARLVLPTPASPVSRTQRSSPAAARRHSASRSATSAARPTSLVPSIIPLPSRRGYRRRRGGRPTLTYEQFRYGFANAALSAGNRGGDQCRGGGGGGVPGPEISPDEPFLAAEGAVERGLGHAGVLQDPFDPDRVDALLVEQLAGRGHQSGPGGGAALLGSRTFLGHGLTLPDQSV